jgi:hypothetical protein
MAEYFTGTLLASPIVRGSSGDTFGTHHSILGIGGYMELRTIAQRDALPPTGLTQANNLNMSIGFDGTSIGQRRLGMLVHVLETNNIYHLHPKSGSTYYTLAQWDAETDNSKINLLTDNNNWYNVPLDLNVTDIGERISRNYVQSGNSFIVGDVIGYNGVEFLRVNSITAKTIEPLGIVTSTGNTFTLTYAGSINTTNIVDYTGNTLSAATTYYLASTGFTGYVPDFGDGKLINIPPVNINEISKPMLVTLKANTGATNTNIGIVLQYRGTSKSSQGITIGQFNTYTGNTQTKYLNQLVTGATNIGYFTGHTGLQTIDILT